MSANKPKLLIVDDIEANILLLHHTLINLDIEIIEASSGPEAVELTLEHDFFAILMDVQMPKMNGFETASLIFDNPKTSHLPIIFITAISKDDAFVIKGYKSGAVDYITKPLNNDILISKIKVFLNLYNLRINSDMLRMKAERLQKEAELSRDKKSEFLANMSHEIRTPMNGVMGMISLAMDTDLTGEQKVFMQTALTSAETLMQIINDILDFSKIEAGKIDLEIINFNIKDLVEEVIALMRTNAESKGLKLKSIHSPDTPQFVYGDPGRIRQILFNLISNAVKFTSDGHIEISITAGNIKSSKGTFNISIKDTGVGISNEKQEEIFGKYNQADSSTTRKFGGTGLGLSICKRLAELMRGKIALESKIGEGSTFMLILPLTIKDPEKTSQNDLRDISFKDSELDKITGKRVLLAEDNPTNQMIQSAMLKRCGCTVVRAENGVEAVNYHKTEDFDLILMDCMMPEMDGYEATQRIRKLESENPLKKTPIVAVTANVMRGDRDKCIKAGMDDYISKPVSYEVLRGALIKWCVKMPLQEGS